MYLSKTLLLAGCLAIANHLCADDWPQWMGPQRDDVWREHGIVSKFSANGPPVLWRAPIQGGYSGPAIVGSNLYVMDRPAGSTLADGQPGVPTAKKERVLCLEAGTGKTVWEYAYPRAYNIGYPAGPRTTPTVADGKVYSLGAMGDLLCLSASDGRVIWERHFPIDYPLATPPVWGWAAHPLLDGERLICLVGGEKTAVVAFHKETGKEIWRALTAKEIGYAPPVIYNIAGRRELIIWHPDAVTGLNPETGTVLWSQPYPVGGQPKRPEVTIAMPRLDGDKLFLTCFYQGSLLLQLSSDSPRVFWNRRSTSEEVMNDGLHTILGTPFIRDGFIYGVCGFGELRCLDERTGDRKWETYRATGGQKAFFANAFMTQQEDRTFLWNDHGELILAKLRPEGYEEISRAKLLDPLEKTRGRTVTWCHPGYAHRCAYVHNGKELICVSLAAG